MPSARAANGRLRGTRSLWFAVLAAPLAWAVMLVVDYGLEEVIVCTPGSAFSGAIRGIGVRPFIFGLNVILLAVAITALAVAVVRFRRLRAADDSTGGVGEWMAVAGIINSTVFGLVIAVGLLPPLLLESCTMAS